MSNPSTPQPDPTVGQQQYPVTEFVIRQRSQELGLLGKIFGGRDHAPINIAGIIIVLGIIALIFMPFLPELRVCRKLIWQR